MLNSYKNICISKVCLQNVSKHGGVYHCIITQVIIKIFVFMYCIYKMRYQMHTSR